MKSSIYISSEKIEVIGYTNAAKSISVKNYMVCPLPEGTMINGTIIDSAHLVECLSAMRAKKPLLFSEPSLIVDGSSILTKRIDAPKLKKHQYIRLIMDDFADSAEDFEDMVCDYHSLNAGSSAILGYVTEKALVDSYISVFGKAEIKLKSIRIGVQSIINYVNSNPALNNKTFILNVIDGVTMLSMIFENGVNVFMSRTRLYSEENEQLIQNIFENLSGLIQFEKSQKFNNITNSYYMGLSRDALNFMREINPYPDITLEHLDIFRDIDGTDKLPAETHFACLNMFLSDDSIDLIHSRKMLDKIKRLERPKNYWIPVLIGAAVLIALPVVYLNSQVSAVNAKIMQLNTYMTDPAVMQKSTQIDALMEETAHYNDVINQLQEKTELDNSKSLVSNQVLELITSTYRHKVSVTDFDFDENAGVIHVNGVCANQVDAAGYVDALKTNSRINAVKYTGYSYGRDGEYKFSVDVTLNNLGAEQ